MKTTDGEALVKAIQEALIMKFVSEVFRGEHLN